MDSTLGLDQLCGTLRRPSIQQVLLLASSESGDIKAPGKDKVFASQGWRAVYYCPPGTAETGLIRCGYIGERLCRLSLIAWSSAGVRFRLSQGFRGVRIYVDSNFCQLGIGIEPDVDFGVMLKVTDVVSADRQRPVPLTSCCSKYSLIRLQKCFVAMFQSSNRYTL